MQERKINSASIVAMQQFTRELHHQNVYTVQRLAATWILCKCKQTKTVFIVSRNIR